MIAKSHTPVSRLVDLAHDLCRSAKRRSFVAQIRRESSDVQTCVDFQVITNPAWLDLGATRRALEIADGVHLTARPYSIAELKRLLDGAALLKDSGFPPGRLHALADALYQGRNQGPVNYLWMFLRARATDLAAQKQALQTIEREWGLGEDRPWRKLPRGGFDTPFGDLLDVFAFARGRE